MRTSKWLEIERFKGGFMYIPNMFVEMRLEFERCVAGDASEFICVI